jgi:lipid-A-disaccharide synthase-like uncharacterized protein
MSPLIYWLFSLGGSMIFLWYGLIRFDIVIIGGQAISYYIYIRNLQLKKFWQNIPSFLQLLIYALPVFSIVAFVIQQGDAQKFSAFDFLHPIIIIGTIGQLALNLRFVYQWYYSEKYKISILPYKFWSISAWASLMVIIYAIFHPVHPWEPVLLVSQSLGIGVYIRNMTLSRRSMCKSTLKIVD